MRSMWMAMGVVAAVLLACGGPEGGLPGGNGTGGNGTGTGPGDNGTTQTPVNTPPETPKSLWPLTTGTTWTYKITDATKGIFEKHVTVLGERAVPGTSDKAIAVENDEPTIDELTYEVAGADGVVYRVREEDTRNGALAKITTWSPAIVKSIAAEKPAGWTNTTTVTETQADPSGATSDPKQKTYVWTVVATDEELTVPAGTFKNVIHLKRERTDKADYLREYWLVAGVGKVKETGDRTEELESYDVKP